MITYTRMYACLINPYNCISWFAQYLTAVVVYWGRKNLNMISCTMHTISTKGVALWIMNCLIFALLFLYVQLQETSEYSLSFFFFLLSCENGFFVTLFYLVSNLHTVALISCSSSLGPSLLIFVPSFTIRKFFLWYLTICAFIDCILPEEGLDLNPMLVKIDSYMGEISNIFAWSCC